MFKPIYDVLIIITLILILIIILALYLRRDKRTSVVTVEFYPPDNLDPVAANYVLTGVPSPKALSSLVVYFANLNLLKIIDTDGKLYLQKLKDIDAEAPEYQKIAFNALFSKSALKNIFQKKEKAIETSEPQQHQQVALKEIERHNAAQFVSANEVVSTHMGGRINRKSFFSSLFVAIISIVPIILFAILYTTRLNDFKGQFFFLAAAKIVPIIVIYVLYFMGFSRVFYAKNSRMLKSLAILFLALVGVASFFLSQDNVVDWMYLRLLTLIPVVLGLILSAKIIGFNDKYRDLFGKMLGFRKNLLLVEKKRIEMLVKENPNYFYDILPYAYVFGISNQFTKQFEGLTVSPPEWYVGNSLTFNLIAFNALFSSNLTRLSTQISSRNTASGFGGRSSGGGFGGGFGGGGFGGGGIGRV